MPIESRILYFFSDNCKVCKSIQSDINAAAEKVPILYIKNEGKNKQLAKQFEVDFFPTMIVITVEDTIIKYKGKKQVMELIKVINQTIEE